MSKNFAHPLFVVGMVDNRQKSEWRGRLLRYLPFLLWIGVVLFASTTTASMSNTSRFIRPLLVFLFPTTPEETLIIYHGYIRKFAHFAEYAALAFFASRAFWGSTKILLQRCWYVFSFLMVISVALIDEFNQSFNVLRTGSIYDVLLDSFGGAMMIGILLVIKKK